MARRQAVEIARGSARKACSVRGRRCRQCEVCAVTSVIVERVRVVTAQCSSEMVGAVRAVLRNERAR